MGKQRTVGFGAPPEPAPGRFLVDPAHDGGVIIFEETTADYHSWQVKECAALDRELWAVASRQVAHEFNQRLKKAGLPSGRWSSRAPTPVERLLGRELCVLAWALQGAEPDKRATVLAQWGLLLPEERWWLFRRAATSEGWRMALAVALSFGQDLKCRLPAMPGVYRVTRE